VVAQDPLAVEPEPELDPGAVEPGEGLQEGAKNDRTGVNAPAEDDIGAIDFEGLVFAFEPVQRDGRGPVGVARGNEG